MTGTKRFSLGPLDHYARSCYFRFCFYLRHLDDVEPESVFTALQDGLRRTIKQHPWLGGRVHLQSPNTPGWRLGQLEVRYEDVVDETRNLPQFRFNQLDTDVTYDDLEDNGFPVDAFSDEQLIWMPLFVPIDADSSPECFAAQANFVPGGCLLVVCTNHTVCDGTAQMDIGKLWAANCDAMQQGPPATVPPPENADRAVIDAIWLSEGRSGKAVGDLPPEVWKLINLDPPYSKVVKKDVEKPTYLQNIGDLQAAIFYMPGPKLHELRQRCLGEAKAGSSTSVSISGNDAMCALIWRSLAKARLRAALQGGRATVRDLEAAGSQIHMLYDGRHNFSHDVPVPYLGNLALINQCERGLASLTAEETTLGDVARDIRDVAEAATHEAVLGAYAVARSVDDLSVLPHGSGSGLASFDNVISSLIMYPMDDLHFGGAFLANGGRPDTLRPLMSDWNKNGRFCFVLPRKANGGVEFVLNMLPDEMVLLMRDPEFSRYATSFS